MSGVFTDIRAWIVGLVLTAVGLSLLAAVKVSQIEDVNIRYAGYACTFQISSNGPNTCAGNNGQTDTNADGSKLNAKSNHATNLVEPVVFHELEFSLPDTFEGLELQLKPVTPAGGCEDFVTGRKVNAPTNNNGGYVPECANFARQVDARNAVIRHFSLHLDGEKKNLYNLTYVCWFLGWEERNEIEGVPCTGDKAGEVPGLGDITQLPLVAVLARIEPIKWYEWWWQKVFE